MLKKTTTTESCAVAGGAGAARRDGRVGLVLLGSAAMAPFTAATMSASECPQFRPTPCANSCRAVNSTTKGILIPSMTGSQRIALQSPAEGLLVYDLSAHRTFQYQNGAWQLFITNDYWAQSGSRKWVYNGTDSIGIGTAAPNERLYVNGNIRSTGDLKVSGSAGVGIIAPESPLHVRTTASSEGIILDAVNPIIQFRQSNTPAAGYTSTGFVQTSGDNLRIGTNSGNTEGKFVIRTNGGDRVSVDASGNMNLTGKLTNTNATGTANLLPVCYGRVSFGASSFTGTPGVTVTKISTGVYEISHALFSATTAIVVTMNQYVGGTYAYPNVEHWTASGPNVYRIQFYNTTVGAARDAGFSFIAYQ